MSRIRSIHPGFFTDEDLVAVSMAARLLFIGLGVESDDKGVFEWKPITIKMRIFPVDNVDVSALLSELTEAGAIRQYEVEGRKYGAIRNFRKFQKPKTPNDRFPAPSDIRNFVGLSDDTSEALKADSPPFPQKGESPPQMEDGGGKMEEKEQPDGCSARGGVPKPTAKPKPKSTRLPDNWAPAEFGIGTDCRGIVELWPPGELARQIERFTAHHTAKGSRFENWQAAWKTWVLNSREFGNGRQANGVGRSGDGRGGSTRSAAQIALDRLHHS